MDDYQNQSADPAAEAEANDIVRNKENPFYRIFHDPGHYRNREISERVQALFSRAHPGESTIGDDPPAHINQALNAELGIKPPEAKPAEPPAGDNQASFGPEWDFTAEQSQEALKNQWGYWHPENLAEIRNPENVGLVFGDFIKNENDKKYLGELFALMGNHPAGHRLYLHLIKKLKGANHE